MNINQRNGNQSVPVETTEPIGDQPETFPRPRLSLSPEPELHNAPSEAREPEKYATRADRRCIKTKLSMSMRWDDDQNAEPNDGSLQNGRTVPGSLRPLCCLEIRR